MQKKAWRAMFGNLDEYDYEIFWAVIGTGFVELRGVQGCWQGDRFAMGVVAR